MAQYLCVLDENSLLSKDEHFKFKQKSLYLFKGTARRPSFFMYYYAQVLIPLKRGSVTDDPLAASQQGQSDSA